MIGIRIGILIGAGLTGTKGVLIGTLIDGGKTGNFTVGADGAGQAPQVCGTDGGTKVSGVQIYDAPLAGKDLT